MGDERKGKSRKSHPILLLAIYHKGRGGGRAFL